LILEVICSGETRDEPPPCGPNWIALSPSAPLDDAAVKHAIQLRKKNMLRAALLRKTAALPGATKFFPAS